MIDGLLPARPQYAYVAGSIPVFDVFHPIDRLTDDDEAIDEPDCGPMKPFIPPIGGGPFLTGSWTPKKPIAGHDDDDAGRAPRHRIGFLKGQISIPDDFDTMFQAEIEAMFEG